MGLLDRFRSKGDGPRVPRKDRTGRSPVTVGLIALVIIVIAVYFGFSKHIPFTHGFQVNAVFDDAHSIKPGSFVRIAGVNVGKVTSVKPYPGSHDAEVSMEVGSEGLPIHKDATARIRPRLFLEGNFYVELQPGTPESPDLGSGDTIPVAQTSSAVQFGDVLNTLQRPVRAALQDTVIGYGGALTRQPDASDDRTADPAVKGLTAAQALNKAARYGGPAFRDTAIVNDAFLGSQPHDLGHLIRSLGGISRALDLHEQQLQDLVGNFDTTMAAFASRSSDLRSSIRQLAPTLDVTDRTLGDLNRAFPPTRVLALDLIPGTRETPATIDASFPWIRQTRGLLQETELRGLAQQLSPATRDLAKTIDASVRLLPQQDLVAKCFTNVILPTGDIKIQDGPLSTGAENYKEFWYTMVGLAGEGASFDGNGMYVRFQTGGGTQTVSVGPSSLSGDTLFGTDPSKPLGTRPAYPGVRPPYKPFVPCYTQQLPDLNAAATGPADQSGSVSGSAASSSGGSSGGGITLPSLPAGTRSTGGGASSSSSVTGALLDRLNPFRGAGR